tara:strand:+ start:75 stop:686 length:612 start_codon:yes stop_codon:yes gene_type:complete
MFTAWDSVFIQAAEEDCSAQEVTGTLPPVTRSISAAFSQDGLAPLSQRFTVGWETLTASANAFCVIPLDFRNCARVIMTQLYAGRMHRSIRQTNNYTDAGIAGIVPVCDTADMKNLARIRKTRGFSQAKLAELSGVKQATISRIESGTNNPSLDTADKIAAALQVSTVELFGLPELEQRFLEAFRSATPERRAALLTLLESDQ